MEVPVSPLYAALRKKPEILKKVNKALARENVAYVRWNGQLYVIKCSFN